MTDKTTPELRELDVEEALALLRRAVNERGADYRYPGSYEFGRGFVDDAGGLLDDDWHREGGCRYFTESDGPACIIGLALSYAGATADDFERWEGALVGAVEVVDGLALSPETRVSLQAAQNQQDEGGTWGEALEDAEYAAAQYPNF